MSIGDSTLTQAQICNAIESTIGAAIATLVTQSYDELTEGINDTPLLQVYPNNGEPDNETAQFTFGRGLIVNRQAFAMDIYTRQRSQIAEDMKSITEMIPTIETVLEAQKEDPFGLGGIKAFTWRWEAVVFTYAGADYSGIRWTINVMLY